MYCPNEYIEPVEDGTIWRYMDMAKFLALLSTESLFFSSIENFTDQYEGSFAPLNLQRTNDADEDEETFNKRRNMNLNIRKTMHINCWHFSDHESEAMWKLYLRNDFGVAIQSTTRKLIEALDIADEKIPYNPNDKISNYASSVHIGKIKYIDYEKDKIPEDCLWAPFLHKRKSFEHEKELRALLFFGYEPNELPESRKFGSNVQVDLNTLVDKVYISPNTAHLMLITGFVGA